MSGLKKKRANCSSLPQLYSTELSPTPTPTLAVEGLLPPMQLVVAGREGTSVEPSEIVTNCCRVKSIKPKDCSCFHIHAFPKVSLKLT